MSRDPGGDRVLDIQPSDLHQRVPVILGSENEVERLVADPSVRKAAPGG